MLCWPQMCVPRKLASAPSATATTKAAAIALVTAVAAAAHAAASARAAATDAPTREFTVAITALPSAATISAATHQYRGRGNNHRFRDHCHRSLFVVDVDHYPALPD